MRQLLYILSCVLLLSLFVTSCSTSKKSRVESSQKEVDHSLDSLFLYGNGGGVSSTQPLARKRAMQSANRELVNAVSTVLYSAIDTYLTTYEIADSISAKSHFKSIARPTINQLVKHRQILHEEVLLDTDSLYQAHVTVGLAGSHIWQGIETQLKYDSELRTHFDVHKLKKEIKRAFVTHNE